MDHMTLHTKFGEDISCTLNLSEQKTIVYYSKQPIK